MTKRAAVKKITARKIIEDEPKPGRPRITGEKKVSTTLSIYPSLKRTLVEQFDSMSDLPFEEIIKLKKTGWFSKK